MKNNVGRLTMTNNIKPLIQVKNLNKIFGTNHVLHDVTENIYKGEKMVIIGPSGSGKSTFLRSLNLLETPTSGEIWYDGELITDPKCMSI